MIVFVKRKGNWLNFFAFFLEINKIFLKIIKKKYSFLLEYFLFYFYSIFRLVSIRLLLFLNKIFLYIELLLLFTVYSFTDKKRECIWFSLCERLSDNGCEIYFIIIKKKEITRPLLLLLIISIEQRRKKMILRS